MYRYKIKIEYIGANYHGSQIQPNVATIQEEIQKAVCTLTRENTKIILSSRTDAGVNALGQIGHFDYKNLICRESFLNSINGILPSTICVNDIKTVDFNFHSQKSAIKRWYRYKIINRKYKSVFDNYSLFERHALNVDRMKEALGYLIGEHDFSSFKAVTNNPSKVCKMYKIDCNKIDDTIYIDFIANRFLYKMIRTIVGTLIMIEKKSYFPSKMREILLLKDRKYAGPTISAKGLTLMSVIYNDDKYNDEINIMEAK